METSKSTFLGALLIITMTATAFGVFCKLQGYPETLFVAIGLGTFGLFWLFVLFSLVKRGELPNKKMWFLATLLLPPLSLVVYLKMRDESQD